MTTNHLLERLRREKPLRPAAESFVVDNVREKTSTGQVEVYVRYDSGARVFLFPKTYPNATILAHIRIELRKVDVDANIKKRLKTLLGKHDL